MSTFDPTVLTGKTDAPPRVYHTFGLMTIETIYKVWKDCDDGKRRPVEVTKEEYVEAGGGELSFAFVIANAAEFNPKLKDAYRRKVDTSKGNFGRDWREIVKPSLVALVGDGDFAHLLGAVHNKYVQIKDAPQASGATRDDGSPWNTLAFVKIYATREECAKDAEAYQAQFTRDSGSNGSTVYPADFLAIYKEHKRAKMLEEIRAMYNGQNAAQVADEYNISEESVKQLVG